MWPNHSGERYKRDPRYIAQKAEAFVKLSGIADSAYFGPELEFFVFDWVSFDQNQHSGYYFVDSEEGIWNSGNMDWPEHGSPPEEQGRLFPGPATDSLQDLRSEMVLKLQGDRHRVRIHHHEVATAGQGEIGMRFSTLTTMADKVMMYKYILKNVANEHGKTVTFMPKPLLEKRYRHARAPVPRKEGGEPVL